MVEATRGGVFGGAALLLAAGTCHADSVRWYGRDWHNVRFGNNMFVSETNRLHVQASGTTGQFQYNGRTIHQGSLHHDTHTIVQNARSVHVNTTVTDGMQAGTGFRLTLDGLGAMTPDDPYHSITFGRFVDSNQYYIDIQVFDNGFEWPPPDRRLVFLDVATPGDHDLRVTVTETALAFFLDGMNIYTERDAFYVPDSIHRVQQGGFSDDPNKWMTFSSYNIQVRTVPLPTGAGMGLAGIGILGAWRAFRRRRP